MNLVNRRVAAITISRLIDTLEALGLMQFDGLGEWEVELYEYWKYTGKRIDLE